MKTTVAIILGNLSAVLTLLIITMIFSIFPALEPSSGFSTSIPFYMAWIISSVIIRRGAHSLSKVFSRGFLLGAAEWLTMFIVCIIVTRKAVSSVVTASSSDAEATGAVIGSWMNAFAGQMWTTSILMALFCLVGFAVSDTMDREMKSEETLPTKKCQQ